MNKVILIGRAVKDAEVKEVGSKMTKTARLTLAVADSMDKEKTDFIPVTAWSKNAEFAEKYVKKGIKILVEGRLTTGSYEKDGKKVYTWEVTADHFEFVESKAAAQEPAQEKAPAKTTELTEEQREVLKKLFPNG